MLHESASPQPPQRDGGAGDWPAPLTAGRHGVLDDVVVALDGRSEADPAAVLFQLLAGFGNLVGTRHFARVDEDVHVGRLWIAVVGTTAARKGLSYGIARSLLAQVDEDWSRKRVGSGLASGEALIEAVRDPDLDNDEPGADDNRFLDLEPELARLLRVTKRDGNTLSSTLRGFWDDGNAQIRRAKDTVIATGAHISVVGHITPSELRREVTTVDLVNGFANRFLLVLCRRAGLHPDGGRMRQADQRKIVTELRKSAEWSRKAQPIELARDANASRLWHQVYAELGNRPDNAYGHVTSRAEAQTLRLSLVLAVLDRSQVVTEQHLRAALDLWRYCDESAKILFGEAFADRTVQRIIDAVTATGDAGLSRTGVNRALHGHVRAPELTELLGDLVARGVLTEFTEKVDSRHSRTAYLIGPADSTESRSRAA